MSVASAAKIKRFTEQKCREWVETPLVNPATGRAIELNKGTYNAIAERCKNAFGIEPGSDLANETPADRSRRLLPKKVGDWTVPRTTEAWMASDVRKHAVILTRAVRKFGFITSRYTEDAAAFNRIGKLLLDAEVIPEGERALAESFVTTLTNAMIPMSKIREHQGFPRTIAEYKLQVEKMIGDKLAGRPVSMTPGALRKDIEVTQFNRFVSEGLTALGPEDAEVDEMLVSLEALDGEIILQRAAAAAATAATAAASNGDADAYEIPASRERSLPESISQRRVKQKKPRREGANPEDADEYYPWSATEEAAPTDRSRFRSHAKLSAVSPGPGAAPLAPLDPKKRTAMLAELREACTVMKDMISMQRFDRMNKKSLQLVVRLGPADRAGQQRCYSARGLYTVWANATKSGRQFADPLTRDRVSNEEKDEIMGKIRHLRPNARDPREHVIPRDPKVTLDIEHIPVPVRNIPTNTLVGQIGMYHLELKRKVGARTYVVFDLGVVPADVEIGDVNGDANRTSAAVIGNIRRLFDEGKLLSGNFAPYSCCTIHLRKPLNYWTTRSGASPMNKRVNMRLWNLMATEVYEALH